MIPVWSIVKVSTPPTQWMQAFPEGAELRVVCRCREPGALTVEVQVNCQPYDMQAVSDSFAGLRVELGDAGIAISLPNRNLHS